VKPLASAVASYPETQDANYADAEIYPDDDICKIFASTSIIGIGYAVVAAFRPPAKGLRVFNFKTRENIHI